ncbi:MAG TPA: hypothetical protein VJA46_05235 [Acidimicrobiia bacterium]|nr:hypothetical protein [Acidimicrobiia bacterium]
MIEFPIPELTQGSDQGAIVKISDVTDLGFILVHPKTGGYVMRVAGIPGTDDLEAAEREARRRFSQILGVLRAFKHGRGELRSEVVRSVARDEHGATVVRIGTVKAYVMFPGELEALAGKAARGSKSSPGFQQAIWLFGHPNRNAGTFDSIYELAKEELNGRDGIRGEPWNQWQTSR